VMLLHPYFFVNMGRNFLVRAGLNCHGFIHGPYSANVRNQARGFIQAQGGMLSVTISPPRPAFVVGVVSAGTPGRPE
jgi:hypothetical protein